MGIYCENSIKNTTASTKEIIEKIYKNTLSQKKKQPLVYRPHTATKEESINGIFRVDMREYYPDAKPGDYAYVSAYFDGLFDADQLINVRENSDVQVYFNNEKVTEFTPTPKGSRDGKIKFRKGRNFLLMKVPCTKESFSVGITVLVSGHRSLMLGYGYCTWHYILKDGFEYQMQPQVSKLFTSEDEEPAPLENTIEWVYPEKPGQPDVFKFDFNRRCHAGKTAYSYTYVSGCITIEHNSPMKVFENGTEIYSACYGTFRKHYSETTPILIKSTKEGENWGFSAESDQDFSLPFVEGANSPDLTWLWLGPFGREEDTIDLPYPPERNLSFDEPYISVCAGPVYWNFYRENTYLKQFLLSTFFGQWFYAIMVGQYGLLQAAKMLADYEYINYFSDSISLLCHHRKYGEYDRKKSTLASYLQSGSVLKDLDSIGTAGMNVAEYYLLSGDVKAEQTMGELASAMMINVPRFDDGTFYRIETMWTDDTYMSLPFLARLGVIYNDNKYFDEILTQIRGYEKRLYMKDQDIFSHIFFPKDNVPNCIPWGRGNGWVLLALSEVLLLMPKEYAGRDEILTLFRKFANGILKFRDEKYGFWHQVINNPDSYMETSGSAMFIIALARGVREGWIDESIKETVIDAWNCLVKECIDTDGNVYGVCMGSSCSMEEKYYLELGTVINDDHGVGIVLTAGVEVMKLENN